MVFQKFLQELRRKNSRGLIVVTGNPEDSLKKLALLNIDNILYVKGYGKSSDNIANTVQHFLRGKNISHTKTPSEVFRRLGEEYNYVLLDVYETLRPNIVAASAEMVKAGGALILITAPWNSWNPTPLNGYSEEHFTKYIKERVLKAHPLLIYDCSADKPIVVKYPKTTVALAKEEKIDYKKFKAHKQLLKLCITEEQALFLEKFIELMRTKHKVLLVKGNRGRGKSSALGLSLAQAILARYIGNAVVTAPSLESVQPLMKMLRKALSALNIKYRVAKRNGLVKTVYGPWFKVEYKEPALTEGAALTVIDEASAIGVARLRRIVWKSHKIIAATTIHGYEGSGHVLEQVVMKSLPNPMVVVFKKPIRYGVNDPLEQWLYETFLLNIEPYTVSEGKVKYVSVNKAELVKNHELLRRMYGLLVIAHYRNMPDDLVTLLDAKHHLIRALINDKGEVVAVAQLAIENGRKEILPKNIGKGLLIIDKFAKYGVNEAVKTVGIRVVRIAVHPGLQRKGYGSLLLESIEKEFSNMDWVASIFSRNEVLHFWVKNGYNVFYISPRYNKVTGEKNIAVIKPLSDGFSKIFAKIAYLFKRKLILSSNSVYRDVQAEVLVEALNSLEKFSFKSMFTLEKEDIVKLRKYVANEIPYHEHIYDVIFMLTAKLVMEGGFSILGNSEKLALVIRFLQGKPLNIVSEVLKIPSNNVEELLRNIFKKIPYM